MKRKIIVFLFTFIILLTSYQQKNESVIISKTYKESEDINYIPPDDKKEEKIVHVLKEDKIIDLELEDYIVGVVSCEMPASFENEALKAMSVAARTYALYKMNGKKEYDLTSTTKDQCYINEEEMKNKWGKSYDKYHDIITNAVYSTVGEYLTYNDKVIISFYFSISNGKTENSEHVFPQKLDYLVGVDSSWDSKYSYKQASKEISIKEFLSKLGINDNKINNIKISRYDSGRVENVIINNKNFSGTKIRTLLKLRSTDFTIEYDDRVVTIVTKGYGHGVGMSQYGANAMALSGSKYDEILKHYYTGVDLVHN